MKQRFASTQSLWNSKGFSLVELLVVVAIIGILMSIAGPMYSDYLRQAKITDGTGAMAEYRIRLEQYFQDNRSYGPASAACAATPAPNSEYFTYACTVGPAPANTFTLTASSKPSQGLGGAAGDFTYTLTETAARGTLKFKGTSYASGIKTCWLKSGGEC